MATPQRTTGLTYGDLLEMFPEDDMVIRELIDGELFVTPPPITRHQRVVRDLLIALSLYAKERGGEAFPSPTGVYLDATNFVEPDVIFVREDRLQSVEHSFIRGAPDLVVEVSSPSTKRRDQTKKRELFERFGASEYWFVDLDHDHVEIRRLAAGRYEEPITVGPGGTLESPLLPGLVIPVDEVLGLSE